MTKQELSRASTADNIGSTRYLLTTQEFAATIDDPRDYQIELYERAKEENTIAVLATGMEHLSPCLKAIDVGRNVDYIQRIWQNPNRYPSLETYH